ncbi:MAG: GTPase, partial [Marmoricola sp.]|nr:GTPase [Marmoricola sp.]
MTSARAARAGVEVGCVLACDIGVLVVLTDEGPVRASYGAMMLGAIARDRSHVPTAGEWVSLRRWSDGPVTVEGTLGRANPSPLARVLPLR